MVASGKKMMPGRMPGRKGKPPSATERQLEQDIAKAQERKVDDAPPPEMFDRITYFCNLHHEHAGDKPITAEVRVHELLKSKYQPFVRRVMLTEEFIPVTDQRFGCWIPAAEIGYVVVENKAGAGMMTHISDEEKKEVEKHVVVARYVGAAKGDTVKPKLTQMYFPEDASTLTLASASGETPINLYIFPR